MLSLEHYSNINHINQVIKEKEIQIENNIENTNQITFNLFKEVCQTFEHYNVYKNNFNKFFKNKNIFRLKIWRLIACYNYLNYLKIYFQFFFLIYYSFCSKYNVIQIYLDHLRTISEWQNVQVAHQETSQRNKKNELNYLYKNGNNYMQNDTDEETCIVNRTNDLFPISSQFNSYKNEVENIIEEFKKRGNMATLLNSYINYFYINKLNYNYILLNLSYIPDENNDVVSKSKEKNNNHKNCENKMDTPTKKKKKKTISTNIFNEIGMSCSKDQMKGLHTLSSKIMRKKKYDYGKKNDLKGKLIFSENYCFKKKSKLILDKHKKKEKNIIKLPCVYSPIYFNVKLLKYFMFVHYYFSSNYNNLINIKKKIETIDMEKNTNFIEIQNNLSKSNKTITFYNIQFYLKKIIEMHDKNNMNTFFNELYMSYIYNCHYYKKFNLSFQRDIKNLFYNPKNAVTSGNNNNNNNDNNNNEKKVSKIKSEKIQFLQEYDSFENILKEKKKIKLIDEKIHNEINYHYQLSNKYMSIDSFQKKYYHEMKHFQEKDQKIKNYFKKNTKLCNISNNNDYNTKINEIIENIKLIHTKQVDKWEYKNVEDFNSLSDKLENKMNYHDYCDPLRRKIFA
ncbi:inositol 5-phosphatase, putative [Plasmodium vinckei lentum]|uniref:Inositol 5-phosphatase, putative n=1 Tax=Plasmodium vinckei lentum TaxID=138297 RepID=A0A6V7SJF2_PLAVN|nr:inositol 5-phosphatase, putative [Plasmodium vinckei lentum]